MPGQTKAEVAEIMMGFAGMDKYDATVNSGDLVRENSTVFGGGGQIDKSETDFLQAGPNAAGKRGVRARLATGHAGRDPVILLSVPSRSSHCLNVISGQEDREIAGHGRLQKVLLVDSTKIVVDDAQQLLCHWPKPAPSDRRSKYCCLTSRASSAAQEVRSPAHPPAREACLS